MSNVTITRHTTATLTIKEIDLTFDIEPHFAPDDTDTVRWAPREGGGYNVAWLCDDDDNGGDFWKDLRENDGELIEFERGCDPSEMLAAARAEHGADRVFIIEVYSHGLNSYSVAGEIDYPDRRWDVGIHGLYVCPEDATDKPAFATAIMREYTDWCNGAVYGVIVRQIDADGNVIDGDDRECWGFIGYDYAMTEVASAVKSGCL